MREVLIALASVVLSGGLVTALLAVRRDRRMAPIETRDTHVAAADTIQQMAMRAAERAEKSAKTAQADAAQAQATSERLQVRIAALEGVQDAMRRELRTWREWGHDLVSRWEHHRAMPHPPTLPRHPDTTDNPT